MISNGYVNFVACCLLLAACKVELSSGLKCCLLLAACKVELSSGLKCCLLLAACKVELSSDLKCLSKHPGHVDFKAPTIVVTSLRCFSSGYPVLVSTVIPREHIRPSTKS